jgi:hypothetical protein
VGLVMGLGRRLVGVLFVGRRHRRMSPPAGILPRHAVPQRRVEVA